MSGKRFLPVRAHTHTAPGGGRVLTPLRPHPAPGLGLLSRPQEGETQGEPG